MKILGTGIDIIEIARLEEKLQKNSAIKEKLFTAQEIVYCESKPNSLESFAGRFAAKEAVYKVLSSLVKGLYFRDIEVEISGLLPTVTSGCKAGIYMSENSIKHSLSISHEKTYAVANAMLWTES